MPIPKLNGNGVLPPHDGDPTNQAAGSPYPATTLELCKTSGTTPERRAILKGLLELRAALRQLQFVNGFQWVDGQFLEDDRHRKKAPDHIHVVFCHPPFLFEEPQHADLAATIKNRKRTRQRCRVDHIPVMLSWPPELVIEHTKHWCGIPSHQRETGVWKGLLKLDLNTPPEDIRGPLGDEVEEDTATEWNLHLTHTHAAGKVKSLTVSTRSGDKKPSYELIGLKDSGRLPAQARHKPPGKATPPQE